MPPAMTPQTNNLTKKQRRLTYAIICIISLLGGVEYAVILPTLYQHLQQTYNAPDYFLGMVLAAFSFSGLFAAPIMGRFYDKTRRSLLLISLSNLFELVGSIMYWFGVSPWFLLSSRLVAGLGNGYFAVVLAEVSHGTTTEERTSVVSAIMAMRQFGLLLGPAFNLFLVKLDFYIGPFIVDKFSAPGIFMAVLWIIAQLLLWIMYSPLTTLAHVPDSPEKNSAIPHNGNQTTHPDYLPETTHGGINGDITAINGDITPVQNGHIDDDSSDSSLTDQPTHIVSIRQIIVEITYHEYMAIFMLTLVALFNQTGVETLATPLCYNYLGWNELDVSLMYCCAGALVLVSFFLVGVFSKKFQDRTLVLFGLLCQIASLSWFFGWVPIFKPVEDDFHRNTIIFIPGIVLNVFGLPFLFVCHIALFSKLLNPNIQGFGHGLRRTVAGLASILGPLWTGGLLSDWYLMLGVMLALNVLAMMLLIFSFKKLYIPVSGGSAVDSEVSSVGSTEPDERSRLINS